MQTLRILCCAAGLLAAACAVAEPVGYVKTVQGEASVVSGGSTVAARPGTPLALGDTLRTGSNGAIGVSLKDNTLLSFGPSTQFKIEEILFAPAKGDLLLGGSLTAGSLHYVSGAIAKLRPEAVKIRTPSGVIGVRGTRFVAVVKEQP